MATRREELELAIKKAMDAESIANCKVIGTARAIATLGPTAYLLSGLRADTEEQQRAEEEVSKAHAAYMAELAGAAQPTPEQIEEQRTQLRGGSILDLGTRVKRLLHVAGFPKDGPEDGGAA